MYNNNNNNNSSSHDNVYGAVTMTKSHYESSPGSSDERRLSAGWLPTLRPSQSTWAESAENWQLSSTSTIAIVIITQLVGWYSFYRPTKGGRLSRPKHCSKGAQPMLKTVYRSSCHDKHNCQWRDSNLGPPTPQSDAVTTRLLRPKFHSML